MAAVFPRWQEWQCELEVQKVDAKELKKMRQILRKMNCDQKFQTSGA
jgi:hypothetical protein